MTVNTSATIATLAAALAKAQATIAPAVKDKNNPAFKSKYADLASVWDACRKPLTDNGLSVVQMPVDAAEPGRVALTTLLLHTSGEYISTTVSTRLTNDNPQGVGSALTYLRRYSLAAIVGVVADEDDDGNAASGKAPQQNSERPQQPAQHNGATMGGEASEQQYRMIFGMTRGWGWSDEDVIAFAQQNGVKLQSLKALTKRQASDLITALKAAEEAATQQEGAK